MSLSSENMMKLMAYADGELDGDELDEAHKLLASDADAARFVQQIAGLGDILERGHEDRSGKTVASFDVADAVMALVKNETKSDAKPAVKVVVSLAAARAKKNNGIKIAGGIAAVLALAASIFVFAQHRTDETPMANGPSAVAVLSPEPAATTSTGTGTGVDVSTVNSPGNSVSVFYLPTANEMSTSVVVWVDETGEKK